MQVVDSRAVIRFSREELVALYKPSNAVLDVPDAVAVLSRKSLPPNFLEAFNMEEVCCMAGWCID